MLKSKNMRYNEVSRILKGSYSAIYNVCARNNNFPGKPKCEWPRVSIQTHRKIRRLVAKQNMSIKQITRLSMSQGTYYIGALENSKTLF